jgi:L-galactonate 5-dehydrogenase
MKALVIGAPKSVGYIDIEEPTQIQQGHVLLQIETLGLCGTDLNTYRGRNPLVSYPRVPGHEIGARIAALGTGVNGWQVGDQVTVVPFVGCGMCRVCQSGRENCCVNLKVLGVQRDGAFSRFLTYPAAKLYKSNKLSSAELALVEPLSIGFHAVNRGRVTADDFVLVLGCGTIGIAAIAGAAARGARVIGLDLAEQKFELAHAAGARYTINPQQQDVEAMLQRWTGGQGPSVVIEAIGTAQTFQNAVSFAGHGGRVVYIGWAKEPVEYDTGKFVFKELDILGSRNSNGEFPWVLEYLESGKFPVEQAITRTVPFDDAASALQDWDAKPSEVNKIQVVLND